MLDVAFLVNTHSRCWWHQRIGHSEVLSLNRLRIRRKILGQASILLHIAIDIDIDSL